ncbi:hypothetical protein [Yinghuangia seranimata]|uniref:hypothetical protein n=1 Tax=Yinghuangia seranimata TaxID=408067 RepID=UPI00248BDC47|nr:hypothetical protein [Yinghuangia seranimata]MDI2129073.1 hypothetical protein [Yinghuangia seranimata]
MACAAVSALVLTACGHNDRTTDPRGAGPSPTTPAPAVTVPGQVPPATGAAGNPSGGASDLPFPPPDPRAPEPQKVADALRHAADRWEASRRSGAPPTFVVVTGAYDTSPLPPAENGRAKASLGNGCVTVPSAVVLALPAPPATGEVVRTDGVRLTRPFVSPGNAVKAWLPDAGRIGCGTAQAPNLTVTAIELITRQVTTSEGRATVPAWRFAFAETAATASVVALAGDRDSAGSAAPGTFAVQQPDAFGVTTALQPDGRTLVVTFVGGPDNPSPCGWDYTVATDQRAGVVAIGIVGKAHAADALCTMVGYTRTASITLDAPLGDRVLLGPSGRVVTLGPTG